MAEEQEAAEPARTSRFPLWIACALAALGLAASAAMAIGRSAAAGEIVAEPDVAAIPEAIGVANPEAVFARHDREISQAPSGSVQRIQAALEMANFLLSAEGWRTEEQRNLMARQYVLAVADLKPEGMLRLRTATLLFRLAAAMRDGELLAGGETLMRGDPPMESIPYELQCAEADALLDFGDSVVAYERIDQLGYQRESNENPWPYLLRMARGIRHALENESAMEALLEHRGAKGSKPTPELLLSELAERSQDVSTCGTTEAEAEGLWNLAFVAERRGETDRQIEYLQQAISKGLTPYRAPAYVRLNEALAKAGREYEHATLLGRMIGRPELRAHGLAELEKRLGLPASPEIARELLTAVEHYVAVGTELEPPSPKLLLAAGRAAFWQGWTQEADDYLRRAEESAVDSRMLGEIMMLRADMAEARGDREGMIRYAVEVISLHPRHPREADIRFMLLQTMASQPSSETDLVGGIIGAVTRLPQDPRGIDGLLMVARRLEEVELDELAETYYRHAILLTTLQQVRDSKRLTAEALLGQARAMMRQGKGAEADALLRVMNTNSRWAEYWNQSGPLWASLAFQQGQFREGVRRWRHTCGPPGGKLLPKLFEMLVPNLGEWAPLIDVALPKKPAQPPREMVVAAADAAIDLLMRRDDVEEAEELIGLMEADPDWGHQLPLAKYRTACLERLAKERPAEETYGWLKRNPVRPDGEDATDLGKWMEDLGAIAGRVATMRQ